MAGAAPQEWPSTYIAAHARTRNAYLGAKWGAIIGRYEATWNSLERSYSIDYQALSDTKPYWATAGISFASRGQRFRCAQLTKSAASLRAWPPSSFSLLDLLVPGQWSERRESQFVAIKVHGVTHLRLQNPL